MAHCGGQWEEMHNSNEVRNKSDFAAVFYYTSSALSSLLLSDPTLGWLCFQFVSAAATAFALHVKTVWAKH